LKYLRSGMFSEAEPLFRACLPIREQKEPDDWRTFNTKVRLGATLLGQKKYAEAEPLVLNGYEGLKQRAATIPLQEKFCLTDAHKWMIDLYEGWGQKNKSDQWRQEMLSTLVAIQPMLTESRSQSADERLTLVESCVTLANQLKEIGNSEQGEKILGTAVS